MYLQQPSGTLITHDADSQLIHIFTILFVLRWHAAWQERCQALERLRACITRKRISFRLFKSWYWQTFDDDMQVRSDWFESIKASLSSTLNVAVLGCCDVLCSMTCMLLLAV